MPNKTIYPLDLQKRILQKAMRIIKQKYDKDNSIIGVYLGGSIADRTFGEYKKPIHQDGEPRLASDIDVMLIISGSMHFPLKKEDQRQFIVRHIGKRPDIPVYRMINKNTQDVLLHGKHPIEPMIATKNMFEGWLSGRYKWGNEQSRPFPELVKKFIIVKETDELRKIRKKYVR